MDSDERKELEAKKKALQAEKKLLAIKLRANPDYLELERLVKERKAELLQEIIRLDEMLINGSFDEDIIAGN